MTDQPAIRLKRARIHNVLGIEELEITPGNCTVISGQNGAGKTSALEAIKSIWKGGTDATLLRRGAEEGEVVLVLSDETVIRKRLKPGGGTDIRVDHPDFGRLSKPQSFLDGLVDPLALDPVQFFNATPAKRLALLLGAIPMELNATQAAEALGDEIATKDFLRTNWNPGEHALVTLDRMRKAVFEDRTGVNRAVTDKQKTISELEPTVNREAMATDWAGEVASHENNLAQIDECTATDKDRIEAEHRKQVDTARKVMDAALEAARAAFRETEVAALDYTQKAKEAVDARVRADRERLQGAVAAAKVKRDGALQAQGVASTLDRLGAESDRLRERGAALSAALAGLDALRADLCAKIPVPGLTVDGGEILLNGSTFDRANTAAQVGALMAVNGLRRGRLPLALVDGLERMDTPTLAELLRQAEAMGLQILGAEVADSPLTVRGEAGKN